MASHKATPFMRQTSYQGSMTAPHDFNSSPSYASPLPPPTRIPRVKNSSATRSRPSSQILQSSSVGHEWLDWASFSTASSQQASREESHTSKRQKIERADLLGGSRAEGSSPLNLQAIPKDAGFSMETYLAGQAPVPDIKIWLAEDSRGEILEDNDRKCRAMGWQSDVDMDL
ncbi:MAG: hypothetical protein Q9215_002062 [Flavoplaca cf. flavocitrina]